MPGVVLTCSVAVVAIGIVSVVDASVVVKLVAFETERCPKQADELASVAYKHLVCELPLKLEQKPHPTRVSHAAPPVALHSLFSSPSNAEHALVADDQKQVWGKL